MVDLSELTVGNLLLKNALNFPDKEALIFEGRRFTYEQINRKANRLANALIDLGVEKGDKVALLFQNCNQFVESYFAVVKIGGVAVSLNWRLTARELQALIDFSDSKVLIYSDMFSEVVGSMVDQLPQVRTAIVDGGKQGGEALRFEGLIADYPDVEPQMEVRSTNGCEMLFTGGTTGAPKGVWRTHEAVVWSGMLSAKALGITAEDRLLLTTPLFHVASLDALLVGALTAGGTVFMLRGFNPEQCLESIQNERLTMAFFVPLMFQLIVGLAAHGEYDLCSLRNWGSAAAPMPLELRRQILTGFPDINLFEAFGQTENPMIAVMTSHNTAGRPESCGRPVPHTLVRILDERGQQVPAGAIGEIAVNGPGSMACYYKNGEATDLTISNGWLLTGDMGRLDEEGYLYIVDRKKDMIITGGENVYAAEVENILIRHPKVQEVAVVGLHDPVWGEKVTAAVVPVQGQAVTEEEIIEFAKKDLASYKCPKQVKFVEGLPKSTLMKVLKRQLKAMLMAEGE